MTEQAASALQQKGAEFMMEYRVDDEDIRPWGHYIVTAVGRTPEGEEYCEKQIVIKPRNILSLQSHNLRREIWTVRQGRLTAIVDGRRIDAGVGDVIEIPVGSIHCMANATNEGCIVHERQEGICREEDIRRYFDAYNRATEVADRGKVEASVAAYKDVLDDIRRRQLV